MKTAILIKNTHVHSIIVRLEPWGEEQEVAPGGEIGCRFVADSPPEIEIQFGEREVVVYGWAGSVLE